MVGNFLAISLKNGTALERTVFLLSPGPTNLISSHNFAGESSTNGFF
jgi:hypothetical protein